MRVATVLSAVTLAVASACAGTVPGDQDGAATNTAETVTTEGLNWTTDEIADEDIAVSYPPGWRRSTVNLMPFLADPRELVALGTFDLPPGGKNCAHTPERALEEMKPTDALIVIEERTVFREGWVATRTDYPKRPLHFGPTDGYSSEAGDCLDQPKAFFDRIIPFRDSGRRFYAYIALGDDVSPAIREEAWAILDRLEIGPGGRC